jgi:hypothetical protein
MLNNSKQVPFDRASPLPEWIKMIIRPITILSWFRVGITLMVSMPGNSQSDDSETGKTNSLVADRRGESICFCLLSIGSSEASRDTVSPKRAI